MNSPAEDIATILEDEATSLGLVKGTSLFVARFPNSPDDCVAIYDNPGSPPMLTLQRSTSDYYYSSVSIRVRDHKYTDGYTQAFGIYEFLHGRKGDTVGTTLYTLIRALDEPQLLHRDKNDRSVFVQNFEVQRRAS